MTRSHREHPPRRSAAGSFVAVSLAAVFIVTVAPFGRSAAARTVDAPSALPGCLTGLYRSDRGSTLALSLAAGRTDAFRASRPDGSSGLFVRGPDGAYVATPDPARPAALAGRLSAVGCDGPVSIVPDDGAAATWVRVPLRVTRTCFASAGVTLYGELIEPIEDGDRPPLFVNVHGSESTAAVDSSSVPLLMALQGVASFVFDKRGTGGSEGTYTQDFDVLSNDVAEAVLTARRLAGDRVVRVGVAGFSQGGWVAPAAASKAPVDFVVVGYGVAGTPIEQDEWQVADELRRAGFTAAEVAAARTVTDVTGRVARCDFACDRALLAPLAARYGSERWYPRIEGQYSGLVLRGEFVRARDESPSVPWDYDWHRWLTRLRVPQLWVLADDDSIAPSAPTVARLLALKRAGQPIDIAVFPGTDHGIRTYRVAADGKRTSVAYADGYLRLLADWIKGTVRPPYGDSRRVQ